jgi:hypothetical protein
MAEWLDPDNLEDPENTTQALLNELAEELDQIAAEVEFWLVCVEVGMFGTQKLNILKKVNQ